MTRAFLILLSLFSFQNFAAESKKVAKEDPSIWTTIEEKTNIQIAEYNKEKDLFKIKVPEEEAVGPLWVTNAALASALSRHAPLKANDISEIVGNEFRTDRPLPVLTYQAYQKYKAHK